MLENKKENLFANSLLGAIIQDGSIKERSDIALISSLQWLKILEIRVYFIFLFLTFLLELD